MTYESIAVQESMTELRALIAAKPRKLTAQYTGLITAAYSKLWEAQKEEEQGV